MNFGQQCEPKVEEQITAVTLNILFFHVKKQQQQKTAKLLTDAYLHFGPSWCEIYSVLTHFCIIQCPIFVGTTYFGVVLNKNNNKNKNRETFCQNRYTKWGESVQ